MVLGVLDGSLRKRYLQENELTFVKAISLALQFESIESQSKILSNAMHSVITNETNIKTDYNATRLSRSNASKRFNENKRVFSLRIFSSISKMSSLWEKNTIIARNWIILKLSVLLKRKIRFLEKWLTFPQIILKVNHSLPNQISEEELQIGIAIDDIWVPNLMSKNKSLNSDTSTIKLKIQAEMLNTIVSRHWGRL